MHLELFDGIEWRQDNIIRPIEKIYGIRVIIDPIEQIIILSRPKTVRGEGATGGIAASIGLRGIHASGELGQESEIAPVQGKVSDVP